MCSNHAENSEKNTDFQGKDKSNLLQADFSPGWGCRINLWQTGCNTGPRVLFLVSDPGQPRLIFHLIALPLQTMLT
jgi:hypothetical protein